MMRRSGFLIGVLSTSVWLMAIAASPIATSTDLAIAGRANAYPSIAAHGQFVAVAWGATTSDGVTDIYAATSGDGGRTFTRPAQVNDAAVHASLSGEQPPRVSLVARAQTVPVVVVTWTAKAEGGTRLLSARSDNGGDSYSRPQALPGSEAPGNRGWQSTATDGNGRLVTLWLDHRELAPPAGSTASTAHAGHEHGASATQQRDGVARAQLSKLFVAREGSPVPAQALTGGVCYCCKTGIATGPGGLVYAAWRHVYAGNIRDIAFTMSRDGGRTFLPPKRVSEDNWVLDGCPENGPAIAVDGRGQIHMVWPTLVPGATPESEPLLALFYATSRDGERFTPRQPIPIDGFARHPQIALDSRGGIVVTWDEQAPAGRRIAIARGARDGNGPPRFTRQTIDSPESGNYPVVATAGEDSVLAWTSGAAGQTVVRTTRLAR